ncbi:MAG: NeuD/PglB/VioB family sugar acetyltransferase [Geodermatophilaceae bacterium]
MRRVLAVGCGGLTRESADLLAANPGTQFAGCVDDDPATHGRVVAGQPVHGGLERLPPLLAADPELQVVLCIANARRPTVRLDVAARLGLETTRYAVLVHPTASVARATTIGPGSILLAHVVTTADAAIGAHCVLMPAVILTHDDVLGDGVTVAAGVRLAGSVRVGAGAYLGSGALIREGVSVGAGAVIGMGSVVLEDIPDGQVWVGNPARLLR